MIREVWWIIHNKINNMYLENADFETSYYKDANLLKGVILCICSPLFMVKNIFLGNNNVWKMHFSITLKQTDSLHSCNWQIFSLKFDVCRLQGPCNWLGEPQRIVDIKPKRSSISAATDSLAHCGPEHLSQFHLGHNHWQHVLCW